MKQELLRMEHVTRVQSGIRILDDLSLHMFCGEILGLLGQTASGKTLISHILAGREQEFSGEIYYHGMLSEDFSGPLCRKGIFCILSVDGLIPDLSVAENIFVMRASGRMFSYIPSRKINQGAREALDRLQAGYINPKWKAKRLSRYEQCVIQLARALVAEADLIVMDTIFEMLSREEQIRLEKTVRLLADMGIGFLLTSRLAECLTPVADRISVIREGRNIRTFARRDCSPEKLVRAMSGVYYNRKAQTGGRRGRDETVLELDRIFLEGLEGFSLELKKGEAVGLWEPRNRKNTALCTMLLGERRGRGGILLSGVPFVPRDIPHAVGRGIGAIRGDPLKTGLVPFMNGADNLLFPAGNKLSGILAGRGLYRYLYQKCRRIQREGTVKCKVEELDAYEQYRILMEKWLLAQPAVFLCIDPCTTSDIVANHIVYGYMEQMMKKGTGILIASSNLSYMTAVCSRIFLFGNGGSWQEVPWEAFDSIDIERFL